MSLSFIYFCLFCKIYFKIVIHIYFIYCGKSTVKLTFFKIFTYLVKSTLSLPSIFSHTLYNRPKICHSPTFINPVKSTLNFLLIYFHSFCKIYSAPKNYHKHSFARNLLITCSSIYLFCLCSLTNFDYSWLCAPIYIYFFLSQSLSNFLCNPALIKK